MSATVATSVEGVGPNIDPTSVYRPPANYVVTIPYNKTKFVFETPYSWMQIQIQYMNYRNEVKSRTLVLPRGRSLIQTTDWPRKKHTCIRIQTLFYHNRTQPLESHLPKILLNLPRTRRNRQTAYVYIVNPRDAITYTEYLIRNVRDNNKLQ
jgi:hypothetical protein